MLDISVLNNKGKIKSDLSIILSLCKETENDRIKWSVKEYIDGRFCDYTTLIDIKNSNKKIKIIFKENRNNTNQSCINIMFNKLKFYPENYYFIREIKSECIDYLLKVIVKKK
jgi:predicted P-loop ATPase/GTPase